MNIYANGCSFTWGGGLVDSLFDDQGKLLDFSNTSNINQQRLAKTWPGILSNAIDAESMINHSIGCGTNDRILRTTLDYFNRLIISDQSVENWLAIIQWTHAERFEYHDDYSMQWCMNSPSWTTFEGVKECNTAAENFRDQYYKITSQQHHAEKMWVQVISLSSFFIAHNIKYIMTQLSSKWLDHLDQPRRDIIFRQVNWMGGNAQFTIGNFFEHDLPSGHPSDLGHKELAGNFKKMIKNDNGN